MAKNRDLVPENLKWRVEDIFETQADWDACYEKVGGMLDFSAYEGKLGDAEVLLECLNKVNEAALDLSRLGVYAFMRHDEDTRKSVSHALRLLLRSAKIGLAQMMQNK